MKSTEWRSIRCLAWTGILALVVAVVGCGDEASPTFAERGGIALGTPESGASPFIGSVPLSGSNLDRISKIDFEIVPKASATARAVHVSFSLDYLKSRGDYVAGAAELTLPLFGMYAGVTNQLQIHVLYADGSETSLPLAFTTAAYVDANEVYDRPLIVTRRAAQQALGFDYFFMKSGYGPPVIVDTDGEIRWARDGTPSVASTLRRNGFEMPDANLRLLRLELDGSSSSFNVIQSAQNNYTSFQHNADFGKTGLLLQPDTLVGGVAAIESTLAEVDDAGDVLSEWRMADIISNYMLAAGDDPTPIVRPGIDWFHMNSAVYDARDDSLIVSSRENFVIKIDYSTGEIKWIFGDPTKYWYASPSLRAKALVLTNDGNYPDGQHALSIGPTGDLVLFDNGQPASYPPTTASQGENRLFSSVASYAIDAAAGTARQNWTFDHDQTIKSPFCSSAQQIGDGSVLISYATADNYTHARLVGLDSARTVVFDFQYDSPVPCGTSWNAQVIELQSLSFD